MTRRGFLRFLGLGALAAPVISKNVLAFPTPEPGENIRAPDLEGDHDIGIHGFREDFTDLVEFMIGKPPHEAKLPKWKAVSIRPGNAFCTTNPCSCGFEQNGGLGIHDNGFRPRFQSPVLIKWIDDTLP
jgi:hypothetical protein